MHVTTDVWRPVFAITCHPLYVRFISWESTEKPKNIFSHAYVAVEPHNMKFYILDVT